MATPRELLGTLYLLAKTGGRFQRALETPLMVRLGASPGLAYHFMVALWMDFNQINKTSLWERGAFELFGLLSEYSMVIDRFADTVDGGKKCLFDPSLWKTHPGFVPYANALACQIRKKHLPLNAKRELLRTIQTYRYTAWNSLLQALKAGPLADIHTVLTHKEQTSGAAFGTCIDLLSITHEVESDQMFQLRSAFSNWGMCLQVTDDLRDLDQDYKLVQNLVASILVTHPDELARLENVGMQSDKIPSLAPETFAHVRSIFDHYLSEVQLSRLSSRPKQQMVAAARSLLWLATSSRWAQVFRSYVKGVLRVLGSHNRESTKLIHPLRNE